MKVVFDHQLPFMLTHGGTQVQIQRTKAALDGLGMATEYLDWWRENQQTDILHNMGWMHPEVIRLARNKGWKVVITILLSQQCNQTRPQWLVRRGMIRALLATPMPSVWKAQLPWRAYHSCDQVIVGLEAEREVLEWVYGVAPSKISVVPLGLPDAFLQAGPPLRTADHLICTGAIGPLRNSIVLAKLALAAKVPIAFVGKPFDYASDYWKQFQALVDGKFVRYHTQVEGESAMIELLRKARGYVLTSTFENWSLATHEAAACGLPLLLPDMRWSRERFGEHARYFPQAGPAGAAAVLREFYDLCPRIPAPGVKLYSWREVGEKLREVYRKLLAGGGASPR